MKSIFKSDILKSNNFYSLFGNLLYAFFSFLLFFYMVRKLSPELYGQWIIYITAASLLDMLRVGLAGTGAVRLIARQTNREQRKVIAAAYLFGLAATLSIGFIFLPAYFVLKHQFTNSYYLPLLLFYPIQALANVATMQANTVSQGIQKFKRVMVNRSIKGLVNLLLIVLYLQFFEARLQQIILIFIISDLLTSVISIAKKWDGLAYIKTVDKNSFKEILKFGKYATASYVGSNLLRSSDTFILSLSAAMGPTAIAIYAIPLKFVELVEIPLRSFTATAYPKLSSALQKSKTLFNNILGQYTLFTYLMLIPLVLALLFFQNLLLSFLGGSAYVSSLATQKQILAIVIMYIILLPFDRYSGMALFALNKPKLNFHKIILMLSTNILFDLLAVFVFQSLVFIALATTIFTVVGIVFGWYHIKKQTGFSWQEVNYKVKIRKVKNRISGFKTRVAITKV